MEHPNEDPTPAADRTHEAEAEAADSPNAEHTESAPGPLDLAGPSRTLAWTIDTDTIVEWPTYTEDDLPHIEGHLPYDVDIYPAGGTKGMGLTGRLPRRGAYQPIPAIPAPRSSAYWDDAVAAFVPSTVVWNGTCSGGVLRPDQTPDGKWRRIYDGTLMGEWPNHPPKREPMRDPVKARLAALEVQEREDA